jgi:RNA polymerase sigma-70 factor (ECF subfamily)
VRQLATRARAHVEAGRPRFPAGAEEEARIVAAFAVAWQEGDHEKLLELLDPDAVMRADGGGKVTAAGKPLLGAERIVRALAGFARAAARQGVEPEGRLARVNGSTGLVIKERGATNVYSLTIDAGRITAIDVVRNPDKLRGLTEREGGR